MRRLPSSAKRGGRSVSALSCARRVARFALSQRPGGRWARRFELTSRCWRAGRERVVEKVSVTRAFVPTSRVRRRGRAVMVSGRRAQVKAFAAAWRWTRGRAVIVAKGREGRRLWERWSVWRWVSGARVDGRRAMRLWERLRVSRATRERRVVGMSRARALWERSRVRREVRWVRVGKMSLVRLLCD